MDERMFDDFYRSSRHRTVSFLYAICGDLADAQDAAQEAYQRAWQRWATLVEYDDPEAWVRTVGYRLVLSRWRKARNRMRAHRRLEVSDVAPPPDENTVLIVTALRSLPADLRVAIVLHHLLDLPVAEVARQMGAPVNTVKVRLLRGRRRLATVLGAQFEATTGTFESEELDHA